MKANRLFIALAAAHMPLMANAQFVPGNEAIGRHPRAIAVAISTPPLHRAAAAVPPCRAVDPCHAGAWNMVETDRGLQECTEPFARPGTCRASTYGSQKLSRVWVVKHEGQWRWCQLPSLSSRCVDLYALPPFNLPYAAVQ